MVLKLSMDLCIILLSDVCNILFLLKFFFELFFKNRVFVVNIFV